MNRSRIFQSDDYQYTTFYIFNRSPKPEAIMFWPPPPTLSGFAITRMHHSFLRHGRFRNTSFSKYSVNW